MFDFFALPTLNITVYLIGYAVFFYIRGHFIELTKHQRTIASRQTLLDTVLLGIVGLGYFSMPLYALIRIIDVDSLNVKRFDYEPIFESLQTAVGSLFMVKDLFELQTFLISSSFSSLLV